MRLVIQMCGAVAASVIACWVAVPLGLAMAGIALVVDGLTSPGIFNKMSDEEFDKSPAINILVLGIALIAGGVWLYADVMLGALVGAITVIVVRAVMAWGRTQHRTQAKPRSKGRRGCPL